MKLLITAVVLFSIRTYLNSRILNIKNGTNYWAEIYSSGEKEQHDHSFKALMTYKFDDEFIDSRQLKRLSLGSQLLFNLSFILFFLAGLLTVISNIK